MSKEQELRKDLMSCADALDTILVVANKFSLNSTDSEKLAVIGLVKSIAKNARDDVQQSVSKEWYE